MTQKEIANRKDNTGKHLSRTLSVIGLSESTTREHLNAFQQRFPALKLALRTNFPEVRVNIYDDKVDRNRLLDSSVEGAVQWVCRRLEPHVFSNCGQSMEQIVGALLREQNATLAVAESCTGGLIANLLTDVPGSSDYFLFSAVTYANLAKMKILNVNAETIVKHGAVSEQTAGEMARGAKTIADATYGLATSGIAGPGGGTRDKPVGTVCIGLATPSSVTGYRFNFTHHNRKRNKRIFAVTALDILRKEMLGAH